ncbi:MAG: ABC transporter substrate-binding protein, partial [Hyphomicrobiales bacterium]|nr:ABC transporter substrate-binding protein [Hyphomicrobiales bacterium]
VIVTISAPAILAVKQATTTIPIVFAGISDPVRTGFVASLARPGGNLTGLSLMAPDLAGKRLELIQSLVPTATRVGMLWNASDEGMALRVRETRLAAPTCVTNISVQASDVLTNAPRLLAKAGLMF